MVRRTRARTGRPPSAPHEQRTERHTENAGTHHCEMSRCALRSTNAVCQMDRQLRGTERSHSRDKVRHDWRAHTKRDYHAQNAAEKLTDFSGRPAAKSSLPNLHEREADDPGGGVEDPTPS